jgi:hypothetical protein
MSGGVDQRRQSAEQALAEFTKRWLAALRCLSITDKPQGQRVQEAMLSFKGLPLHNLPRKLQRRIDTHFGWINTILEPYALQTWDDYQKIAAADLTRIGKIIDALGNAD